jgi:hypothetical protein
MVMPVKTWMEQRIETEERDDESSGEEVERKGDQGSTEINMVFNLPSEFELPESEMAQLALGVKRAVFEKPEELGKHMRPLYIKGHLDGAPVDHMLVDGGVRQHHAMHDVQEAWPY